MSSANMPDMGEKKHLAPPQGFTTATTDAERKWLNHAYRVLFFFFSTLLTFLNLISDDIGAFLFTLTGQNTSHLHTGAHQDPTPTLASSPQKKEKHKMDCVCWQMVPVPLYQSINHSPPGLHEENHFILAQQCYWLSAGNYQEKAIIPVSWFNGKEDAAWCCCHMTVPDFKRH